LDKDTKEQLTINDSTEPTPEKMVEIQAKEIVRLNDALERYSAEVIRLNTEIERLKEAKLCLSRENMALYEQLNKIEDALNNNNESGEDKNFIQKLFCKKSNK
jgi:chromosome segregation ATPase